MESYAALRPNKKPFLSEVDKKDKQGFIIEILAIHLLCKVKVIEE